MHVDSIHINTTVCLVVAVVVFTREHTRLTHQEQAQVLSRGRCRGWERQCTETSTSHRGDMFNPYFPKIRTTRLTNSAHSLVHCDWGSKRRGGVVFLNPSDKGPRSRAQLESHRVRIMDGSAVIFVLVRLGLKVPETRVEVA